jgi:hypothetical protein
MFQFRGRIGKSNPSHSSDQRRLNVRWDGILVAFFRALAIAQMLKGLIHWGFILFGANNEPGFLNSDSEWFAANIYFAVIDPVAAVGLWLTSSWGAVLWMLAAGSQIAMSVFFPEVFGPLLALAVWNVLLIGVYGWLSWQAAAAGHKNG